MSGRSITTDFFYIKLSISVHSGSIGICIKKSENNSTFNFLSPKGTEGGGEELMS